MNNLTYTPGDLTNMPMYGVSGLHFCVQQCHPDIRWYKITDNEARLQQAWMCNFCGTIEWKDVPVVMGNE